MKKFRTVLREDVDGTTIGVWQILQRGADRNVIGGTIDAVSEHVERSSWISAEYRRDLSGLLIEHPDLARVRQIGSSSRLTHEQSAVAEVEGFSKCHIARRRIREP